MATYNDKQKAIEAMGILGHNILEVEIAGTSRFFIARRFEAPVGGSVSAAPFLTFTGFDITDFFVGNVYSEGNMNTFKIAWEAIELVAKDRDYKFSDKHVWRYFE